jgi:hypothetical protein
MVERRRGSLWGATALFVASLLVGWPFGGAPSDPGSVRAALPGAPASVPYGRHYSSYLGGAATDRARAVAIGPGGNLYLAGETGSNDLPLTPGAFDAGFNGVYDAFAAIVTPPQVERVYRRRLVRG